MLNWSKIIQVDLKPSFNLFHLSSACTDKNKYIAELDNMMGLTLEQDLG